LAKNNLNVGDKVAVLIHRLYLFDNNKVKVVENKFKNNIKSYSI
jgi:hypothetical protein